MTGMDGGRTPRWEATHRRIYAAAMRLFQEHGFERVNIAQLAAAAEVSVPTFYAHFPSKEHIVMQLPTAAELESMLSGQSLDLPVGVRLRRAIRNWLSGLSDDERADVLARWTLISSTPSLRTRAASFERTTSELVALSLPADTGQVLTPAETVIVDAHLAAYTAGLLAWADEAGRRALHEVIDEFLGALQAGVAAITAPPSARPG